MAGLNSMGTSEGVANAHAARVSRVTEIPTSHNAVRPSKMVDTKTTNLTTPERKNRMETLRKNTVKRRWKRIGNKTIDNNDSKASPWQLSRNPFEALAKQSKKRHQIKINSLNEDDDIHVEKLLAEEEAAIYREEEEAKQAFYQNEQDITQARIENLENMLVGINCCLERLSDKMGVDGPPKAIISQQLSTIEQESNYENEESVLPKSAGSSRPVYSSEVHSSHANSSHINSNKDISSKSTSKQNSNKELLTTTDGDDQPKTSQISIDITGASR